ncbi:MAG TPA: tetratricopeptide repeat protein [archaeon]|nr:tetratricopeptide repeat protein [archaeon]
MGFLKIFEKSSKGNARRAYEQELALTERKAETCLKKGDYLCAATAYQLLAKIAEEMDDLDNAIIFYKKAVQYSEADHRVFNIAWIYRLIGNILFKQKKYREAIEAAAKSAEYFIKSGSIYAAQWSYNLAARSSEAKNDVYSAIRFYKKSLQLADDPEVKAEVDRLRKASPHPMVLELTDKKQLKEGQQAEFKIVVENNSMEPIRKVRLVNKDETVLEEINDLKPYEEKYFSYKVTGRVGVLKPSYRKVLWENGIGDIFEEEIDPTEVRIVPNVEVITSINPEARLSRPSDFIILVKNKSSSKIRKVGISANFPDSLKVTPLTKTSFEAVGPGEEKGAVFAVTPLLVGETKITNITIKYKDEFGVNYEEKVEPFLVEEIIKEPEVKKSYKQITSELGKTGVEYLKMMENRRSEIDVNPHPISQEEFVRLTKTYPSAQRGYVLNHTSVEHVAAHIVDACSAMTLLSTHKFEKEQLFLFSGVNLDTVYLLTVAVKEDGGPITILFKAYSNKKEALDKFITACSDLVEYTIMVMTSAKEVEKIEVNQVVKIIDSIIQRSNIGADIAKNKETVVKDSVVQRAQI